MIEFFEFLNTCSGIRTIIYMIFILVFVFITFAGIADIIKRITNNGDVYMVEPTEEKEEDEED